MENKYYTPSIEEFRVGFEYEYKDLAHNLKDFEWFKDSIKYDGYDYIIPSYIQKWINEGNVRVKYLDKEDIESLGWKWEILETKTCIKMYIFKQYHLNIDMYKSKLAIYTNDTIKLFEGTIKNKSELQVLMKQLRIK